jgi:hypothetical protein
MPQINSSGAVERFSLAANESKVFVTEDPGGNVWVIDLHGDNQETANASVKLQTSEDGVTYSDVGSAVTLVPGGVGSLTGATGRWAKILNNGANTGFCHVVAKPMRIVQGRPGI